ncbi:hypothetical protein [Nocardiopsis salina]|uniref:hypothetical protein n=1 Tax=Nocardiopsis salina TaxID=245836 RepID=UPI00047716CF|nr:hypothetical protein [Nocardiopsis salina]
MFPSGHDPNDHDGARGGGDIPPQGDFSGLEAHLDAMRPDAPTPKKVMIVRTLMFIGGACGIGIALMVLLSLGAPEQEMRESFAEQERLMAEQGVEVDIDVGYMRSLMANLLAVTGVYGALSVLLASRIRNRTVGVFWGVVLFQGLAAAILVFALFAGDFTILIPLGFTITMLVFMISKESRAHYGLL